MVHGWMAAAGVAVCLSLAACGGSELVCRGGPGSDDCTVRGGAAEAVGTAAVAGAAWAAWGCTVNGCLLPYRCNADTGYCEPIPCREGAGVCPAGYSCHPEDRVCR